MQRGKAKKTMACRSTLTSYAGAVKASHQKLTITRKESEGDGGMYIMGLREVQSAVTKEILSADTVFFFEDKVLMICEDEKT